MQHFFDFSCPESSRTFIRQVLFPPHSFGTILYIEPDTKLSKTPEKNAAKETVVKIHAMYTLVWYVFHSALNMGKVVHNTQFYTKKCSLKIFPSLCRSKNYSKINL